MKDRTAFVVVDGEATGTTPYSGTMTEFGAVDVASGRGFYAHLWPFTPHPQVPARPVIAPGATPQVHTGLAEPGREPNRRDHADITEAFTAFADYLAELTTGRCVFVSDNPAYDFMWIADGFDRCGLANPFGYSGRRIGDLAAGLSGNWRNTSGWKRHRATGHDHNPLHDARGNVEALRFLLERLGQTLPD